MTTSPKPQRPLPRVRREPPTLDEAIFAAEGLTDDLDSQVEIAAGLMGVPEDQVRTHMRRSLPTRTSSIQAGRRTVVVVQRRSHARLGTA